MSNPRRGSTPNKWGLNKRTEKLNETTLNKEYKTVKKLKAKNGKGIDCIICMGLCGYGPYRANKYKRNCGKKPRYKNIDRRSLKNYGGISVSG